jgi:ribonuclease BN (tRNA processing enzyme)
MVAYGGNTSCVEVVKTNKQGVKVPVVIDAGSGLIKFGYALAGKLQSNEYSKTFTMLFTHLHPDHTEGFNFFVPNFFPFCKLYLLGMETLKYNVGMVLKGKMLPPTFPIEYKDLKSHRVHGSLHDAQTFFISQNGVPVARDADALLEISVMQAYSPSHPQQGALYYRIRDMEDGSSVACIWDIESHIGGDVRVIRFADHADLMIHDTQYLDEEYASALNPVQGFGHSTYEMAIENARKAEVKYLASFHYNPRHSDDILDEVKDRYTKALTDIAFIMSHEGLSLTLRDGLIVEQSTIIEGFAKVST